MPDTLLSELLLLILRLVEADDKRNSEPPEDWHIIIWCERAISVSCIQRARESNELARHNPIQVTIFDFLEVLVFLNIKVVIVVPSEGDAVLEALETVKIRASIGAITHRGISVGDELVVVGLEYSPSLLS